MKNIGVIGLGLIGGSFALNLKLLYPDFNITGISPIIDYKDELEVAFSSNINWEYKRQKLIHLMGIFRLRRLIKNFKEKVVKTFIHGYLHLLGFDHIKDKEYRRMVSEEEKIYKSVISKIN